MGNSLITLTGISMEVPHAVESDITYGPENAIYRRLPARVI